MSPAHELSLDEQSHLVGVHRTLPEGGDVVVVEVVGEGGIEEG